MAAANTKHTNMQKTKKKKEKNMQLYERKKRKRETTNYKLKA